ncbi:FAD-dependent oxidoreductase [Rhodobacterales bacterium HKCCE3408]|nr:FAD-dependent oxidoreductase [Rhodobacterales bacterium HKCCE3408]
MHEFLVIGGGIAGISAAARLSHLGRVLLFETESALGYHASGRSAALFEETYGKPTTVALNRASKDYHMTANGGVLSPRALMLVDDGEGGFEADLATMKMEELDGAAACALVPILNPDVVRRAGYRAEAWDIDTDRLIQNFAREMRGNGGTILFEAEVTAIARIEGGWQVTAKGEVHDGRILVNAAGAWADRIAAMAGIAPLNIQPLRRSMARLAAPGGHDVTGWPMMFGPGERWYAKPDAGALLVSPADEDPVEPHDAWADDMVLAEGLARYEAAVTEPVTRPIATWAGLRSFAPDRQLVIGFEADEPSFLWVAAQGGYGMQTAPAASQLAADLVAGRAPDVGAELAAALSPARLR